MAASYFEGTETDQVVVYVYAWNTLHPVLCTDLDQTGMEFLFIKLLAISFPLYTGVYYRQPNQPKTERDAFLEGLRVQFVYLMSNPQVF